MEMIPMALLTTGGIAALTILMMLNIIAERANRDLQVHDLKLKTHQLRIEYAERLAKLKAGMVEEPEVVMEGEKR